MDTVGERIVAGVFPSYAQAEAAYQGLQRLGLDGQELEIGAPAAGSYRVEFDEAAEFGRGAAIGVAVGTLAGGIIGIAAINVIVPGILYTGGMNAALLGFLIGGFWGIFFGGLGGVVPKVLAQEHGPARYAVAEGGHEAVVIAHAGGLAGDAHKVMERQGARAFLAAAPALTAAVPAGAVVAHA